VNQQKALTDYNAFRKLCLVNSASAIRAADELVGKQLNHIAYHLCVLSIEELGKIFAGYHEFVRSEEWGKDAPNYGFDDHIKKLFWAVWGPTIGQEIISNETWKENQQMATKLHQRRLELLYTGIADTQPAADKIDDAEVAELLAFAKSRLALAEVEGEADPDETPNPQHEWFHGAVAESNKRKFIFGQASMEKLIELGNTHAWIVYLQEHFQQLEQEMASLVENARKQTTIDDTADFVPKWRIKIKLYSTSHAIKQTVLNQINVEGDMVKLTRGSDPHTLLVELTLPSVVPITAVWHQGWFLSKLYAAALNIGTNGFFYWHATTDTERYFESIVDMESGKHVDARILSGLALNWEDQKRKVHLNHLAVTKMVFEYFLQLRDGKITGAMNRYQQALALMAKSDLHARFEPQVFQLFFQALKICLTETAQPDPAATIKDMAWKEMEGMAHTRHSLDKMIDLGYELEANNQPLSQPITLAEVILMKQYAGFHFMTLAARLQQNDPTAKLVLDEGML